MNTDFTKITPRFEIVQRSAFGSDSTMIAPLENLKYYLFIYKDGINTGNEIDDSDLEFWRINSHMDIIAVCDVSYILNKNQPEPEWQKVNQK